VLFDGACAPQRLPRSPSQRRRESKRSARSRRCGRDGRRAAEAARARFQRFLERLRNRSSITLHQFQAGDRLYRDYLARGSQIGRLTMRYEPPTTRTPGARDTPGSIAARERFEAALRDAGRGLAPILMHVCITDELPTTWPGPTGGLPLLRVALDVLVDFYRGAARRHAA
jgi:hypothetical protein